MNYRPIIIDNSKQELTQHGTPEFPMSMDRMILSDKGCADVQHWHQEIQIVLVTQGKVCFRVNQDSFSLSTGQGVFLNSRVLHEASPAGLHISEYICVNFRPEILYHSTGSSIYRDYIDPLLTSPTMECVALRQEPWQQEICSLLSYMGQIYDNCSYGYELQVISILSQIFFLLATNCRSSLETSSQVAFPDKQRIRTLQNYIHQNYMEDISLADIAGSAHISRGECCRVFKRVCQMTPFQYLINHRISQSAKLLRNSSHSIAEIAGMVGFGSSSYFIQCFKKEMQQTPLEYRMHCNSQI